MTRDDLEPPEQHARFWQVDRERWGAAPREPMSRVAQLAASNIAAA